MLQSGPARRYNWRGVGDQGFGEVSAVAKQVLTCPKCSGKLAAPEGAERFRCPTCKAVLSAPKGGGQEAAVSQTATATFGEQATSAVTPLVPSPGRVETPAPSPGRGAADGEPGPGQRLGGYTIVRLIGRGGMGAVYEAIQEGLKRRVAIKVLPEVAGRDTSFLENFKREAQAVAKLNHPNIVQVFDIDQDRGYHFFSMEYVQGQSLAQRLEAEGRLPLSEAVQIVAQAAAALAFAYERMLVHRDIKPSNILLTEQGDVKLGDLGLSKSLEGTSVGIVRGTYGGPLYMAPEFAKNPRLADCRSDIYALGCVLFHALTGRPPFAASNVAELVLAHAEAPFPSARAIVPQLPQGIDSLLSKMCAKDPAARYQNYDELLGAMQSLLRGTSFRLPRVAPAEEGAAAGEPRRARRKSWLPLAIGVTAATAVAAALLLIVVPRLRGTGAQAVVPGTSVPPDAGKVKTPPPPTKPAPPVLPEEKKDEPVVPVLPPPEPKEEPPPKEEPKEEPKEVPPPKADGPAWQAALAQAKKNGEALAAENQFGKAIALLDEVAGDNEDPELRKAVDDAKAALRARAAKAYEAVVRRVRDLAAQGKLDDAKAALQAVVDAFGTDAEVGEAVAAAAAIGQHQESLASLRQGAEAARAAAAATERRAELQAEAAKAFQAVGTLLENWQLARALEELAKMKFEDPEFAAQVEQRKAAIEALAAYRDLLAQHIRAANPRLRKGDLRISGLNGDLTHADAEGITAIVGGPAGQQEERIPWAKLAEGTVDRLSKLREIAKPGDVGQQLALGLWMRLLGNEQRARVFFDRAADLGAKTDALGLAAEAAEKSQKEAQAARAFAQALELCLAGKAREAEAALAEYKEKFSETDFYGAQSRVLEVAADFKPYTPPALPQPERPPEPKAKQPEPKAKQPEPKGKQPEPKAKQPEPKEKAPPGDEEKAKEAYERAVAAYRARRFEECAKQLEALRAASPGSPLLANKGLNPTVEAMRAAIAARGQTLHVGSGQKGAHPSLEKALAAIEKPKATIEIAAGNYPRTGITIPTRNGEGLILRGVGDSRPRLDGGPKRETILTIEKDTKDVWLERLEFVNTKAAVDININVSLTFRDCLAVHNVASVLSRHPITKVTIISSILRFDKLPDATVRHSLVQLADKAVLDGVDLVGAIIVGSNMVFKKATLTDCLILGDASLEGDVKLNHVTATGPVEVPEDARNNTVADSILASLAISGPKLRGAKAKEKRAGVAVTLTNSALYAQRAVLHKELVKQEEVLARTGRPPFEDAASHDYRLPKDSPLAQKGSGNTPLGCRFPPEMLEVLRAAAKRFPQTLRPLPPAPK